MEATLRESEFADQAREALIKCFEEVPFLSVSDVEVDVPSAGMRIDLRARLQTPIGEKMVIVEIKNNGQPRIVRVAINQLLRFQRDYPEAYLVFVAPFISDDAAKLCRSEGVGYVDLAGNCFLNFEPLFISKEGKANPFNRKRDLRSLYSPKAERVLRVLLASLAPRKMQPLAAEANVSLGQVFNVKELLLNREWAEASKDGLKLVAPAKLLAEWSENYDLHRSAFREFRTTKSTAEFEQLLAGECEANGLDYALAGLSSAARYAPMVRHERVTAYVVHLDALVKRLQLEKVSSGGNVELITPYDDWLLYGAEMKDGVKVTSPVQTYLDLRQLKELGEEAADLLLRQVIQPTWS